jgi:iron complex transport system ATP-binding protein
VVSRPQALLQAEDLCVSVAGIRVCDGLDLRVEAGQSWAILGRNGAGKTTLLHVLAGLRPPDAGRLEMHGEAVEDLSPHRRALQRAVLFQDDADPFPASVLESALAGRFPHLGRWGWERAADLAAANRALEAVDLAASAARDVQTLSGGERRRLAIATLLAQEPRLALLDEPTNHLDPHYQILVLDLLGRQLRGEDRGLVTVLHDVNLALRFCDHALLLFGDGQWCGGPTPSLVTETSLTRLYGHPMALIGGPRGPVAVPG